MLEKNNNEELIRENDEKIILARSIFCIISFSCCFILIFVYFILCLQMKCGICTRNKNDSKDFLESDTSSEEGKKKNNNNKGKIGLGSNFMFLLLFLIFLVQFLNFYFIFITKI